MQNRIRFAFTVQFRPCHGAESHMFIKSYGLGVLFVNVDFGGMLFVDGIKNQLFPDAFASAVVVNEQHFYIPPLPDR